MLQGTTTQAHTGKGLTEPIATTRGLPQGHTLSPMLFALYINDLIQELQQAKTANPESLADVACLAYADDLVIIADTLEEAQEQVTRAGRWAAEWGMQINLSKGKTEHMVIGGSEDEDEPEAGAADAPSSGPRPRLRLGHELISRTKKYKYLGVMISSADRGLNMPDTKKGMLGAAMGAHNSVMRLKVAAPDLPPGVLGTIWQTWVLPQLMYGIGVWMRDTQWEAAQKFMNMCGRQLLDAPCGTPNAVVMAELGWRSVSFWIQYHRCRTLSRMLRAPAGDLTLMTLQDEMKMMHNVPGQSWLEKTVDVIQNGRDLPEFRRLRMFMERRVSLLDFADSEARAAELNRLELEKVWCNILLDTELNAWKDNVDLGATRRIYDNFVSERRDRGTSYEPKRRWATISRPPKSLRHVASKADAKLLTSTRLGDRRFLSHQLNTASVKLGVNCPCCGAAIDSAPHMVQCDAIRSNVGVEEAFEQLKTSLTGVNIKIRGSGDSNILLLADFVMARHLNAGAEKVLLGNCDASCVPANLRSLYRALHCERDAHALWIKGVVRVLRACWAAHDAAVADKLAAAGAPPPAPPQARQPTRQQSLREWRDSEVEGGHMPQVHFDAAGLIAGIHVPGELAPQGEQEVKEEEDEGPLLERKEADDGDALPALRGLGDLARMSSPDHPAPDLLGSQPCSPQSQPESAPAALGLADLLPPPAASGAGSDPPPPCAASPMPPDEPGFAQSLMSMLQAAPRGLLSLVGAHVPEAQGNNISDNNNNNNSPPRAPFSRQQPAANTRVDAACPHCAQRSAPCPACCSATSSKGPSGVRGLPS